MRVRDSSSSVYILILKLRLLGAKEQDAHHVFWTGYDSLLHNLICTLQCRYRWTILFFGISQWRGEHRLTDIDGEEDGIFLSYVALSSQTESHFELSLALTVSSISSSSSSSSFQLSFSSAIVVFTWFILQGMDKKTRRQVLVVAFKYEESRSTSRNKATTSRKRNTQSREVQIVLPNPLEPIGLAPSTTVIDPCTSSFDRPLELPLFLQPRRIS
jgi:hypothetical protein